MQTSQEQPARAYTLNLNSTAFRHEQPSRQAEQESSGTSARAHQLLASSRSKPSLRRRRNSAEREEADRRVIRPGHQFRRRPFEDAPSTAVGSSVSDVPPLRPPGSEAAGIAAEMSSISFWASSLAGSGW